MLENTKTIFYWSVLNYIRYKTISERNMHFYAAMTKNICYYFVKANPAGRPSEHLYKPHSVPVMDQQQLKAPASVSLHEQTGNKACAPHVAAVTTTTHNDSFMKIP